MAKSRECLIGIDLANALNQFVHEMKLKIVKRDIGFRCPECFRPVDPHRAGKGEPAHFEHRIKNPSCSRSIKERRRVATQL